MRTVPRLASALVSLVALAYPLALAALAAMFRAVGERWWVAGVALYLPRVFWGIPLPFLVAGLWLSRHKGLLWTQLLAGALVAFVLMGLELPRPVHASAGPAVRVLSYNINSSNGGADAIFGEIDRYAPDIVLLQEAWRSGRLVDLLRTRYATVETTNQFVLATRFRLVSSVDPEKLDYRGQSRSARFVQQVLETPIGRLAVYNIHPISPRPAFAALRGQGLRREISSGHIFSPANAAAFLENAGLREGQVRAVAEAARAERDPVIIAGDTNLPTLSFVLHRYLSDYRDGFAEAGRGFGYTFPSNHTPWMRIDRILASDALRFVHFEVGASRASDHLCVVADVQRR